MGRWLIVGNVLRKGHVRSHRAFPLRQLLIKKGEIRTSQRLNRQTPGYQVTDEMSAGLRQMHFIHPRDDAERAGASGSAPQSCQSRKCHIANHFATKKPIFLQGTDKRTCWGKQRIYSNRDSLSFVKCTRLCAAPRKSVIN